MVKLSMSFPGPVMPSRMKSPRQQHLLLLTLVAQVDAEPHVGGLESPVAS